MRVCGRCWLLAAAIAAGSPSLGAEAARVRFVYIDRSRANCPDEANLRGAAVARLGYDPFAATGESTLHVTITRTARGLRGKIRLEDPQGGNVGARAIESSGGDCAELAKAMALAISLAIDPLRALDVGPPSGATPTPTPSHPPTSAPLRSGTGETATAPSPSESKGAGPPDAEPGAPAEGMTPARPATSQAFRGETGWQLSVAGLAAAGFSSGIVPGASLGAGWAGSSFALEAEGRVDLPATMTMAGGGGSIRVSPLLFTLAGCARLKRWGFCGFGRTGRLYGSGQGFAVDAGGASLFASVGARLTWEAILTEPFRFRAFIDLDGVLTGNTFDVDRKPAWAVSTVAVSLGLAALVR